MVCNKIRASDGRCVFERIDPQDLPDGNCTRFAADCRSRRVFLREVVSEPDLSACTIPFNATCSLAVSAVADDPGFVIGAEVEAGWLGFTRHFSLISRIAAGVVKRFLPIRSTAKLPRLTSARKADTETMPRRRSLASLSVIGSVSIRSARTADS
jgi:hypothetical protein